MTTVSRAMSLVVGLIGALVLLGWALDIDLLRSGVPGLVAMNPVTAVAFILAGGTLYLTGEEPVPLARRRIARLGVTAVLLIGLSVLIHYVTGWEAGLDQLLFHEKLAGSGTGYRNRMAPNTAVMFMLVGASLLSLDSRDRLIRKGSELLCLAAGLLTFFALTGYLYDSRRLYGVASYIPMALNTALAFGALIIGMLAARPARGLAALLLSTSSGGVMARRLLPATIVIPVVLGLLRLAGERQGLYDAAGGVAMLVTLTTISLATLVVWSAGVLDRTEAALRDAKEKVDERTLVEAEMRAQKDFLRRVVDTNPQLVFIKDWEGRFVLANRAVAEIYGTSAEQLEGKTDADFNSNAAEVAKFLEADREVMRSGRPLVVPEDAVTDGRTGTTRWFHTIKVPLAAPDGQGKQVLGVSTDITDRRHAEEQLRRSTDELEALVQAAPVAIVGIDMDGKVLSWYGGAESMFGWTAEEMVGRPPAIVPPEKQEEFRALQGRVLRGDSFTGFETSRVRKDGSTIDVSISTAALHGRDGRIVGIIAVYQDITERRLMAEQRQARETADAANRAKSNFLANMSHELRTPLNAIIGFSELLEDQTFGPLNERQQRYLNNVHTSGRHLLQLVNDILDLAKIEAGRLVLEPESINLKALLQDMQRGLEPLAVTKRQTFVLQAPDELPPVVADRGKVKQILYNLLSNAIKFTREGGRLGVRAAAVMADHGQPQIQVEVWDTGIGIAPEDLKRIFLEFEQLDSSYVRQQEGTGLGLALTQRLVEAHGGRIWVESRVGEGSTFTFVLPGSQPASGRAPLSPPVRVVGRDRRQPLVLVVEDDTTGRELLAHYLVENGYSVAYAGTGGEAVDLARELQPAAISLDILLPDEHGLQVLSRLRADPQTKDIPVIIVSITDDRELGLSAGAAAWLVKPVQRRQFIEALDRVMPNGSADGRRLALVVDDDADAVELASDILRQRGFEVLQAFGGNEGLSLALERLPSLIILDLSMPGVSGFTVAQQLRADPRTRQTPILVSTALDLTTAEREELLRHVQTIVPKSGAEAILQALERIGLTPRRDTGSAAPPDQKARSV
jgi:PAS domain S-box-containing protein